MLNQRINRIIGQLKGINRMLDQKRECGEVLQQISAIKKAIDGLSTEIVLEDMQKYVASDEAQRLARVVERAINL